jgi:ABC-type Fe3+ transport system substrate-binding protein
MVTQVLDKEIVRMKRRSSPWLSAIVLSSVLAALACAPASGPSPTAAPPKAAPAAPAEPAKDKPAAKVEQPSAKEGLFQQLVRASEVELAKKGGKLSVALEFEKAETDPLFQAFRTDFPFVKETSYERVRTPEQMQKFLAESKAGRAPAFDIMHVSFEAWKDYTEAGVFPKPQFSYKELAKAVPQGWSEPDARAIDPNDMFIATTGLARGNAWNKNMVPKGQEPTTWEACLDPKWRGKVMYDPRPKLTALQHDPKTREAHLQWLRGLLGNGVILGRGQTENLEKVAAGEYPIFCGVNYHSATRAIDDGAPLEFAFPDPFPIEFGTQIHVLQWSETPATTQLFVLWLSTRGQPLLEKHAYRGFPWDPNGRKFPLAQGKYVAICEVQCLQKSGEYDQEHARILGLPGA